MGLDLGMALGSAVNTGVNTYTKLQEEARLGEADKRTAEQFEWQRKEQAGKQALQTAASDVVNMGDTQNVPDQAAMANKQGAYQQYEGEDGPVTPTQAVPISAKDKQAIFVKKALAGGANPLDVMNYQKGSLELKALNRQADKEDQFDEGMKKIQDQSANHLAIATSGNGKELVKIANKEGLDVREKQNKDGTITYEYYDDGKLTKSFNDVNALAHAGNELLLGHWMKTEGVKLLGSPAAVGSYIVSKKKEQQEDTKIGILQQEANTKQQTADTNKNFYGSGGVYERVNLAKINEKTSEFTSKLKPAVQFSLGQQKQGLAITQKNMEADPTNKGLEIQFGKQMLRYNQTLKDNGLDINVYDGTGIPDAQEAARQIMSIKGIDQKGINERLNAARNISPQYADEVKKILDANKSAPAATKNTIESKNTSPVAAIPIVKTNLSARKLTEEQIQLAKEQQQISTEKALQEKNNKQSSKLESDAKKAKAIQIEKDDQIKKEKDYTAHQINILELRKEKALKKGNDMDVRMLDSTITRLKKQIQD